MHFFKIRNESEVQLSNKRTDVHTNWHRVVHHGAPLWPRHRWAVTGALSGADSHDYDCSCRVKLLSFPLVITAGFSLMYWSSIIGCCRCTLFRRCELCSGCVSNWTLCLSDKKFKLWNQWQYFNYNHHHWPWSQQAKPLSLVVFLWLLLWYYMEIYMSSPLRVTSKTEVATKWILLLFYFGEWNLLS